MTVTVPLDREFSQTVTSNSRLYFEPTGGPLQPLRVIGGFLPGIVVATAGATPDEGFLWCDGTVYNIATYPDLFARISNLYGGNGTTTFAVPDCRGRSIIGRETTLVSRITNAISGIIGTVLGATGGDESLYAHTHTITDPTHSHSPYDPTHTHSLYDPTHSHYFLQGDTTPASYTSRAGNGDGGNNFYTLTLAAATGQSVYANYAGTSVYANYTGINGTNTGGAGTAQNVPPGIVLNYQISY